MRKFIFTLLLFLMDNSMALAGAIDEKIDAVMAPISDFLSGIVFYPIPLFGAEIPITILWILIAGIFVTLYFRGVSIWGFKHALSLILSKEKKETDEGSGEVSTLQALCTALSGTVGLGSIAGVAISISIGGPGAAFWILVGALFGMSLKLCESTLAIKYRRFNPDGSVSGGPMHYIAHGLTRKGLRWLGQPMALLFAFLLIPGALGGGNMLQANQATIQVINMTGGENSIFYNNAWMVGLLIAIFVGTVVIGGIKSIVKVTEKIVPFMCVLYVILASILVLMHITQLPVALMTIIKEAFMPNAIYGGVAGTIIIGLRRSVQSNEAGAGSAPIAYATVKTKEPLKQGFVSLLEPFITACMCLLSASSLVVTGAYLQFTDGVSGIQITAKAFEGLFWGSDIILAIIVILFAVTTIISWAYYGQKGLTYMFGEKKWLIFAFQIVFCLFIVVGSSMNVQSIIDFTDAGLLAMSIPNIIAIYILIPDIKKDLKAYALKNKLALEFNKRWYKNS